MTETCDCGRPVKRDGRCGVHARAHEEYVRKADAKHAEMLARMERGKRIEALAADLRALGIPVHTGWGARIELTEETALMIVARLRADA